MVACAAREVGCDLFAAEYSIFGHILRRVALCDRYKLPVLVPASFSLRPCQGYITALRSCATSRHFPQLREHGFLRPSTDTIFIAVRRRFGGFCADAMHAHLTRQIHHSDPLASQCRRPAFR